MQPSLRSAVEHAHHPEETQTHSQPLPLAPPPRPQELVFNNLVFNNIKCYFYYSETGCGY